MSHFLYLNISNNNPVPAPTVASATRLPTKLATVDSFVTLEGHGTTPKSDLQRSLDHHNSDKVNDFQTHGILAKDEGQ